MAGDAHFNEGRFPEALRHYREAVWLNPLVKEYHLRLGRAASKLNQNDWARRHFAEALRLDPNYADAHEALGQMYLEAGDLPHALEHSAAAVSRAPNNPLIVMSHALVLATNGQASAAWAMLEPLTKAPPDPAIAARLASVCAAVGRKAGHGTEALALINRAVGESATTPPAQRQSLHFQAAALLDQLGRYDEAFDHARLANDLARRRSAPHDPVAHAEWISQRIAYATPQRVAAMPRATHGNRRPVFIVGMPRSGTSLVEQILASHPAVYGAGELTALGDAAVSIAKAGWSEGDPYPQCLESLSVRRANRLASQYLSHIESLDREATYVTDKMPLNGMLLGLVDLLLPGCHVIHCVRNPLDTCLSCYLTGFNSGNEFTFDLGHLGAYYRDYRRLMDHWKAVLGLPILEVRYEDLVLEPEAQVRRMLGFLKLPWDERCMKFHENPRFVNTASHDQVRKPLYTSSVGRWKHYEKHLAPLMDALGTSSAASAGPVAP